METPTQTPPQEQFDDASHPGGVMHGPYQYEGIGLGLGYDEANHVTRENLRAVREAHELGRISLAKSETLAAPINQELAKIMAAEDEALMGAVTTPESRPAPYFGKRAPQPTERQKRRQAFRRRVSA